MANQSARLCIVEDVVDFFDRKPCVQWNYDYSEPGTGINELDVIRLVRKKNGQPVSGFEAMFRQCRSNPPHASVQFAESRARSVCGKRGPLRKISDRATYRVDANHSGDFF